MQVTIKPQERKEWWSKEICCPATGNPRNDYECLTCDGGFYPDGLPCFHRVGVFQRVKNHIMKDPLKVPEWVFQLNHFKELKP